MIRVETNSDADFEEEEEEEEPEFSGKQVLALSLLGKPSRTKSSNGLK